MEEKKKKITVRKILKYIVFSISAAVYIVFFVRFFVSCDADITDDVFLTPEQKIKFEDLSLDYPLYHYQPTAWTSDDGTVQIKNIYYLEPINTLELTVRHRIDAYNPNSDTYPFTFKVRVSGDVEYETVPEIKLETRYGYTYARLIAEGIVSDHGETVTAEVETFDENGNSVISTETEIKGGTQVHLDILSLSGERLFTFEIAGKGVVNYARIRRSGVDIRELN